MTEQELLILLGLEQQGTTGKALIFAWGARGRAFKSPRADQSIQQLTAITFLPITGSGHIQGHIRLRKLLLHLVLSCQESGEISEGITTLKFYCERCKT